MRELQEAEVGSRMEVPEAEEEAEAVPSLGEAEVVGRMTFSRSTIRGIEMVSNVVPCAGRDRVADISAQPDLGNIRKTNPDVVLE